MRNGIVIVVEGVNTGLVGAYGTNTAITPALDRLAAHGLVLDQCFVDSMDGRKQLYSLWTGQHAAAAIDDNVAASDWTLWKQLAANGFESCLVTDCPVAASVAERLGCARVTLVEADEPTEPAENWTECSLMRVFVAAIDELDGDTPNQLIWIHSRGLRHAWDAPLDLRAKFIDPEDPDPPSEACLPSITIDEETDPDDVIGWAQVAAAQVAVVDQGIEILMNTIELREDADNWIWMVVSPGGVPLGEHGRVGWGAPQLYGEEVSCLAIIKADAQQVIGSRRAELCQLPDLTLTLLDALQSLPPSTVPTWGRSLLQLGPFSAPTQWPAMFQSAYIVDSPSSQRWIRTPAWSVTANSERSPQLFVKPDDRWETSDVASRRSDIVDRLQEIAGEFEQCLRTNTRQTLPTLEDELCNLLR